MIDAHGRPTQVGALVVRVRTELLLSAHRARRAEEERGSHLAAELRESELARQLGTGLAPTSILQEEAEADSGASAEEPECDKEARVAGSIRGDGRISHWVVPFLTPRAMRGSR